MILKTNPKESMYYAIRKNILYKWITYPTLSFVNACLHSVKESRDLIWRLDNFIQNSKSLKSCLHL